MCGDDPSQRTIHPRAGGLGKDPSPQWRPLQAAHVPALCFSRAHVSLTGPLCPLTWGEMDPLEHACSGFSHCLQILRPAGLYVAIIPVLA